MMPPHAFIPRYLALYAKETVSLEMFSRHIYNLDIFMRRLLRVTKTPLTMKSVGLGGGRPSQPNNNNPSSSVSTCSTHSIADAGDLALLRSVIRSSNAYSVTRPQHHFNPDEIRALYDVCNGYFEKLLLLTLFSTGM